MPQKMPVVLWTCCGVIVLASFMPWWSIDLQDQFSRAMKQASREMPQMGEAFGQMFAQMAGASTGKVLKVNAWKSKVVFLGIHLPNWMVIMAVAALLICDWLNSTGQYDIDKRVLIGIAVYGLAHTAIFCFTTMRQSMMGFGAFVSLVAFIVALVVLIRDQRMEEEQVYDYPSQGYYEE